MFIGPWAHQLVMLTASQARDPSAEQRERSSWPNLNVASSDPLKTSNEKAGHLTPGLRHLTPLALSLKEHWKSLCHSRICCRLARRYRRKHPLSWSSREWVDSVWQAVNLNAGGHGPCWPVSWLLASARPKHQVQPLLRTFVLEAKMRLH